MPPHVFDSSVWIKLHKETPPVFYVTLWDRIERGISDGEIRSPDEVCTELAEGTDGLEKFLKTKAGLFVPLDDPIQAEVSIVMAECPSLSDPNSLRHRADPFVVALAKHYGSVVVSMENPRKDPTGPMKIPDACSHFGLPHMKWFAFLESMHWTV